MKKGVVSIISVFAIFLILLSFSQLTQAAEGDAQEAGQATNEFFQGVKTFFAEAFGITEATAEEVQNFFTRVFFAILLFLIIKMSVDVMFGKKAFTSTVISLIITTIAVIAIPVEILNALRVQYGAVGATILAVIPFLVLFLFSIRTRSTVVARVIWLTYAIYYFVFFIIKLFQTSESFWPVWYTGGQWLVQWSTQTWVYFLALVAGIIIFLTIGMLRAAFFKEYIKDLEEHGKNVVRSAQALHELQGEELQAYLAGDTATK